MPRLSFCRHILDNGERCRNQVDVSTPFCYAHVPDITAPPSIGNFVANVLHESRLPDEHLQTIVAEFCEALPQIERGFNATRFMSIATDGQESDEPAPRFNQGVMDGVLGRNRRQRPEAIEYFPDVTIRQPSWAGGVVPGEIRLDPPLVSETTWDEDEDDYEPPEPDED